MPRSGWRKAKRRVWPPRFRRTRLTCFSSTNVISAARQAFPFLKRSCRNESPCEFTSMPFAAALSTGAATSQALDEVCHEALAALGGTPDLALVFYSPHHLRSAGQLMEVLPDRLKARGFIGCSAIAVAGNDREIEEQPAMSLWLAKWNKPVEIETFHLTLEQTSDGYSLLGWPDGISEADPAQ